MSYLLEKFNIHRKDSGWLRLFITLIYSGTSILFLLLGYELILSGTTGSWNIVSSFKGWELYATSISPGLLVVLLAALILICGLPRTIKSLE